MGSGADAGDTPDLAHAISGDTNVLLSACGDAVDRDDWDLFSIPDTREVAVQAIASPDGLLKATLPDQAGTTSR